MKVYQVGGSVRDLVLQKKPHDFDYVVVGGNAADMLKKGFKQVGHDFPVFLHPVTGDEYALARKEIKTGDKHTDFQFVFDENVTLAEDLQRRDFTCNALARDIKSGEIVDLTGGLEDIKNKTLRHVNSAHFGEDPLRVLRMCRFAAQLDFQIAPETMELARDMVKKNMLAHLTPERIWKEFEKALQTPHFDTFIAAMHDCGALKAVMPEADRLWNVPEKTEYHPEGNSGAHTLLTLKQANNCAPKVKFAMLLHDIGKTLTPPDILPAHYDHDKNGLPLVAKICTRLKVPNDYRDFAKLVCEKHMKFHCVPEMKTAKLLDFVDGITKFKNRRILEDFIAACKCDTLGRGGEIPQIDIAKFDIAKKRCLKTFDTVAPVKAETMPEFDRLPRNEKFREAYRQYRLKLIRDI